MATSAKASKTTMDTVGERETRSIPLSKLHLSERNVRKTEVPKDSTKQLEASIASQGVLQNLIVTPEGRGTFGVVAGGRRFRALQALLQRKAIKGNYPVPCVVKKVHVIEASLAENVNQAPMHPADQYEAFHALQEEGQTVAEIALRFGVAKQTVQRLLKLAVVAPDLLNAYRRDEIKIDALAAFTVVDDQERQRACFKELKKRLWPQAIRSWLLGEVVDTSRGIGRFVGKAAYVKAGGAVSGDLFENTVYLTDVELVCELANKKLQAAADKLAVDEPGWKWIELTHERFEGRNGLINLSAEHVGVPEELEAEIASVRDQCDDITELFDAYYQTDVLPEGYANEEALVTESQRIEDALDALEEKRDDYLAYTDERRAYGGCIVSFDGEGNLTIDRGFARKGDIPRETAKSVGTQGAADRTGEGGDTDTAGPISNALETDLAAYRRQIIKASLLKDPAAAADVMLFSLCRSLLITDRYTGRSGTTVRAVDMPCDTSKEDTGRGRAFDELTAERDKLSMEWAALGSTGEQFAALRKLGKRDKERLMTYCTTLTLDMGIRGHSDISDRLVDDLKIDFAGYWRPTDSNYFSRLKKDQLLEQFGPVLGSQWLNDHQDATKKTIVGSLAQRFADAKPGDDKQGDAITEWVPPQF